jgi:PEP-CTERM motif-containing protein
MRFSTIVLSTCAAVASTSSVFNKVSFVAALMLGLCAATGSQATTPLALDYSISSGPTPGEYTYTFTLILNNNDGSWVAGQNFDWITFGDEYLAASPLADFVINPASFPVGPYTIANFTFSGGGHNGPTFVAYPNEGWVPSAVGDTLTWSGESSAYLSQGQLLFSDLIGTGNHANFDVATLVTSAIPEPSTWAMLLLGFAGLGFAGYRRRQKLAGEASV